jgi:hypothetical protein
MLPFFFRIEAMLFTNVINAFVRLDRETVAYDLQKPFPTSNMFHLLWDWERYGPRLRQLRETGHPDCSNCPLPILLDLMNRDLGMVYDSGTLEDLTRLDDWAARALPNYTNCLPGVRAEHFARLHDEYTKQSTLAKEALNDPVPTI